MDPRGGGGDEGDEEDRGVEGGETPSVLGGFAQLTIAPAPLEEDSVGPVRLQVHVGLVVPRRFDTATSTTSLSFFNSLEANSSAYPV